MTMRMTMQMTMTNRGSLLLLLLLVTALFISTNPVAGQRQGVSDGQSVARSNSSIYKVHLYNYVVEAGTGVNIKSPIRPVPPNLRWSSYAVDKALDGENLGGSSNEQSRRFNEKCQERLKRPCTDVFAINAVRKTLTMSEVSLDQADIIRVFQGTDGGFSSQFVQRRYKPANETAPYHRDSADSEIEEVQPYRFEIKEAVNINYAIYLSVYEGHVCSFASKPKVVRRGDTLRLRCHIVMNGYWTPSLFFRNEYDGSIYETKTTSCNSPVRPYRYCGLVDVPVETVVLAFACHVRFPVDGRFQPTIAAYADAQWPLHNHHSPVCYLEKLFVDTIPSDVNFLCDKMPCEDTIGVGQEISCQADAYPRPVIQLSILVAELPPASAANDATTEEPDEVGPLPEDYEFQGEELNEEEEEVVEMEEKEEETETVDGRLFHDSDDVAEEANTTPEPDETTASEPPAMETQQQPDQQVGEAEHSTSTNDAFEPEEANATTNSSLEQLDDPSLAEKATDDQTPELPTPLTPTPEMEKPEGENAEVEKPEVDGPTEETHVDADERNDTSKDSDREENRPTPMQKEEQSEEEKDEEEKDNEEKDQGSGEPDEKDSKHGEDNWGSEGEGEKVTTVEVYKVTQELVGKVVEVTCNISNSVGWGSNSIILHVTSATVTPLHPSPSEDGPKEEVTPSTDKENRTAKTGDGSEGHWSDPTEQPETSLPDQTVDQSSVSGEHFDHTKSQTWQKVVPTDGGFHPDNGTNDEGSGNEKTPAHGSHTSDDASSGDESVVTFTTVDEAEWRTTPTEPHTIDPESQLELARKYGPKEIKVYCNGALCIGLPRMFVGDTLRCEAQGTPSPNISFMVEGGRIIDSATYQLTDTDRGSLTITCIAKNHYGSMTSRIVLTVSQKRTEIVKKFRKDDTSAGRPRSRVMPFIVGLNAFVSIAAAYHHRLLSLSH